MLYRRSLSLNIYNLHFFSAVDKSEAGDADLEVQVESPTGVMTPLEVKTGPSSEMVEWTPEAPGQYRITIFYGGDEVIFKYL